MKILLTYVIGFVNNKLIIHFGEDKTKSIFFVSKRKIKKLQKLYITYYIIYNISQTRQHCLVTYLGCILEETMSGESIAHKVISKIKVLTSEK